MSARRLTTALCMGLTGLFWMSRAELSAQNARRGGITPVQIEEQIERVQRAFAESESRLLRLQELRLRLAFGLPVDAERYFKISADELEMVKDRGGEQLVTEEAELERLSLHANELSERLDSRRHGGAGRGGGRGVAAAPGGGVSPSFDLSRTGMTKRVDVPRIDIGVGGLGLSGGHRSSMAGTGAEESVADLLASSLPFPATDAPSDDASEEPALAEDPPPPAHIIAGSERHGAVGRVLLRSGERFLREAAKTVDAQTVEKLKARAMQMFEQSKAELEPLSKTKKPELIDLYHLGRCEEKLGNHAAADSLYAQIISRDQYVNDEGIEVYGQWGQAAQAAKSVLRWVQDSGGWKPTRDIDAIQW